MTQNKLFFIFFLVYSISFGQIKIKGIVSDSLEIPLQAASIVAINNTSNSLEAYALTDENGYYNLNVNESTAYKIQVSSIGLMTVMTLLRLPRKIF